jgi:hypothetical protein
MKITLSAVAALMLITAGARAEGEGNGDPFPFAAAGTVTVTVTAPPAVASLQTVPPGWARSGQIATETAQVLAPRTPRHR